MITVACSVQQAAITVLQNIMYVCECVFGLL
jgi:hypothetical protein